MKGLLADCRHAVALYIQTPGASLISVLVLAVGMAFVGAFLSLYVDLVLRPHPGFEEGGRISTVGIEYGTDITSVSFETFEKIADELPSIETAAAWIGSNLYIGREREVALLGMVSAGFFPGLRPRVQLGRGLVAADHAPNAEPVAVLSYRYWQQRFDGDPNILGTVIEIGRNPATSYLGPPGSGFLNRFEPESDAAQFRVVGVMAQALPGLPSRVGLFEPPAWIPLERVWPLFFGVPESLPGTSVAAVYVRKNPGVSAKAIAAELRARYDGSDARQDVYPSASFYAIDGLVGEIFVYRDAKQQLEMFLAGSVLLALTAAADVALFFLARAPGRRRELGIRLAVGASTKRLARQFATESGLLIFTAGLLGLIGSVWISLYLRGSTLFRESDWSDVRLLDWRVVGLSVIVLAAVVLLASLAHIVGINRLHIAASSGQITAHASLVQRLIGVTQIAIACTLAGAALAFGWHVGALTLGEPGYEIRNRVAVQFSRFMSVQLPQEVRTDSTASARPIIERARRRDVIEAIPGVDSVAFGEPLPGLTGFSPAPGQILDPSDADNAIEVYVGAVDRAFVDLLGLKLLYGQVPESFEPGAVVVNQALARALWGRDDVVGERVPGHSRWNRNGAEIVGVLADLSYEHPSSSVKPMVFTTSGSLTALVETQLAPVRLQEELEGIISAGVIDARIISIDSLPSLRNELIAADRARGLLTMTAAALVVLLAAFGFYGTQRYLVAAGRREYGIRAALGAGPRNLATLVLWRGLTMSLPGLVVGGLLAFIVVALLRDDYVSRDVSPGVVTTLVIVGLALVLLAASLAPALEAKRTRPEPLLREI